MESLGRKLANRIIKPEVLKKYSSALEIDLDQEDIYIDVESVFLGGTTNFTLNKLLNDDVTITDREYKHFYMARIQLFL